MDDERSGLEPVVELPTEESLLELPEACETLMNSLHSTNMNMIESLNRPPTQLTVLVADDNPYNLFVIELLLKEIRGLDIFLVTA